MLCDLVIRSSSYNRLRHLNPTSSYSLSWAFRTHLSLSMALSCTCAEPRWVVESFPTLLVMVSASASTSSLTIELIKPASSTIWLTCIPSSQLNGPTTAILQFCGTILSIRLFAFYSIVCATVANTLELFVIKPAGFWRFEFTFCIISFHIFSKRLIAVIMSSMSSSIAPTSAASTACSILWPR